MFTKKLLGLINPIQSFLIRLWEIFLSNIGVTSFQNDIKIPPSLKVSRSYCIKHFFTLFQWISETFINTLYSLFWIHLKFQKAFFFRFFFSDVHAGMKKMWQWMNRRMDILRYSCWLIAIKGLLIFLALISLQIEANREQSLNLFFFLRGFAGTVSAWKPQGCISKRRRSVSL